MAVRKTLGKFLLYGTLLGLTGCYSVNSPYDYNGKIGKDWVTFEKTNYITGPDRSLLEVIKSDGRVINYVDWGSDLELESVIIKKNGKVTEYAKNNEIGEPVLKEAQKQFDIYLRQIKEIKTQLRNGKVNQGLENLK